MTVTTVDYDTEPNAAAKYELLGDPEPFTIDEDSGVIQLHNSLNREDIAQYLVVVTATDPGFTPATSKF